MVLRTPVKIDQPVKSSIFQSKMADLLHNFPRKLPVRFWWFENHIGSRFLAHSITFRLLWNLYSVSSYSTISDTERAPSKICAYHCPVLHYTIRFYTEKNQLGRFQHYLKPTWRLNFGYTRSSWNLHKIFWASQILYIRHFSSFFSLFFVWETLTKVFLLISTLFDWGKNLQSSFEYSEPLP